MLCWLQKPVQGTQNTRRSSSTHIGVLCAALACDLLPRIVLLLQDNRAWAEDERAPAGRPFADWWVCWGRAACPNACVFSPSPFLLAPNQIINVHNHANT